MAVFTPMLVHTQMNRLQQKLKSELLILQKELDTLPDGTLYIYKSRRWITYYMRRDGKTRGITKDKDLIYQLARRQYLLLLARLIRECLRDPDGDYYAETIDSFLSEFNAMISKIRHSGNHFHDD